VPVYLTKRLVLTVFHMQLGGATAVIMLKVFQV